MLDQVILVNEQDEPVGVMDKVMAHRVPGHLHRASSVFLFDTQGHVLLQKRSTQKLVGAGQWANTCCGNLRPGEDFKACALRRLREELGITDVSLMPIHKFQYFAECNDEFCEREIDQVFVGVYEGDIKVNPEEVSEWQWQEWPKLISQVEKDQKQKYVPWLPLVLKPDFFIKVTDFRKTL